MREILFRGKDIDNGIFVTGYLIGNGTGKKYITLVGSHCKEVIPETIGQYTGLTDKNGRRIFEGDIVKSDNGSVSAISVVQYGGFEPKLFYDLIEIYIRPRPTKKLYGLFAKSTKGEEMLLTECSHLIEVIGNIHDNPELLKGGVQE